MGVFVEEKFSSSAVVKGITAFAEKKDACILDTGIYLPPGHSFSSSTVNVILWLHGFYVQNARDLMHPDSADMEMNLRQSVLKSQKNAILVAPWQGLKSSSASGRLSLDSLGQGNGLGTYLDEVLKAIVNFQKTLSSGATSSLALGHLVIAGHSAGGAQMREASKHLGSYQNNLRECWGFDCFYDDLYPAWIKATGNVRKYFYFARGSGGGGLYAFNLMKMIYGTPKKPVRGSQPVANTYLAPAVDRNLTSRDDVAFQTIDEILDWGPAGPNLYNDVRKATDPFLDDGNASRYWNKIHPKLTGHFQMVRDLFGPRIAQSRWL